MANDVKVRYKSYLPGGGVDGSGNPKQGKQEVRGLIDVTSYSRGGEALTPSDIGLRTVDYVDLRVEEPVKSPNPAQGRREAHYSYAAQEFYVVETNAAGTEDEFAASGTVKVRFNAFGDSAEDVELL